MHGAEDLPPFLSEQRDEYITAWQEGTCADAVLSIREGAETGSGVAFADGWQHRRIGDLYRAAYIREKQILFVLEYRHPIDNVTVYLKSREDASVRSAVQFGALTALYEHCFGMHGVTLKFGDEIIILSAPSGTGKTTLSRLLEEYPDANVINGDFALLSLSEEGVMFEPSVFCGSSGISQNIRVRVDRVVFLSQSPENYMTVLCGRQAVQQFMNNCFTPVWDSVLFRAVEDHILNCIPRLKINSFGFAPDHHAAEVFTRAVNMKDKD